MISEPGVNRQWIRRERQVAITGVVDVVIRLLFVGTRIIRTRDGGVGGHGHVEFPQRFLACRGFVRRGSGRVDIPVLAIGRRNVNLFDREIV